MKRIALIAATLLLAFPVTASASGDDVIADCADDGALSRTYSQAEYKKALADLPADLDEYTDCRSTIRRAQLAKARSTTSSATAGKRKVSKKDADEVNKKVNEQLASSGPLRIGKAVVKPGNLDSSSSIPAPLIAVLVLSVLGAIGASAIAIRRNH